MDPVKVYTIYCAFLLFFGQAFLCLAVAVTSLHLGRQTSNELDRKFNFKDAWSFFGFAAFYFSFGVAAMCGMVYIGGIYHTYVWTCRMLAVGVIFTLIVVWHESRKAALRPAN